MKTLVLNDIVLNSSSEKQGAILYNELSEAYSNSNVLVLEVGPNLTLSSSFLNASIGAFLDSYGYVNFKKTVKFKGSRNQFARVQKYLKEYRELFLV